MKLKPCIYIIHKKDKNWVVEVKRGPAVEKTEHSSREKALASFWKRHPRISEFYVVIPRGGSGKEATT